MNAKQILAKILEEDEVALPVKMVPCLHIVRKPEPKPVAVKRVSFNEQRRDIRALLEEGWLRPYHQVYLEIDGRMETPERLPYEDWLKNLSKSRGRYGTQRTQLQFWNDIINDVLELTGDYYNFSWGKATFNIRADLQGIYTFWKAFNKRI